MNALHKKQELLNSVIKADLESMSQLLEESDINSIFPNGKTLLIIAIESQRPEVVEFLIRAGANLNKRDFHDRTPLMYAADKQNVPIAHSLLNAGADVNARNKQGRTSLMYAAYKDSVEMVETLLGAGADLNARDNKDRSAWNYSGYKQSKKCRELLSAQGADTRLPETEKGQMNLMQRLRYTLSVDEFTELKDSPNWSFGDFFWYCAFLPVIVMLGECNPFVLVFLPIFLWRLLKTFPSILKIYSAGKELLNLRYGKRLSLESEQNRPAREFSNQSNLEFVSHLMEIGSGELLSIHQKYPDQQSLGEKKAIFRTRIASILLAISVFSVVFIFLNPNLFNQIVYPISNANRIWLYGSIWLILSIWIVIAHKLEFRLRLTRMQMIQKGRDRIAGEISNMLNADSYNQKELPASFGLYLRAFMTTNNLHIKGFDLETILAYSIAPTLPLLALGKPGEHLGSGRIQTTDEHWQEEILRLMDAARIILIIPSHRDGTLWEISTLRERGYFEKTIFIMPPEMIFHSGKFSDDWEKTVTEARKVGVEFPLHLFAGAFFRLGHDGGFEDYAPFTTEKFLEEFDPGGRGGAQDSIQETIDETDADGEIDNSEDGLDNSVESDGMDMDGVDFDGGMDGDGGLAADGVDGGAFGSDGGGGDGDGGGGDGGGGDGGGGY